MAYVHLVLLVLSAACLGMAAVDKDVRLPGISWRPYIGWAGLAVYVFADFVVELAGLVP